MPKPIEDLSDQMFGNLEVLKLYDRHKGNARWLCACTVRKDGKECRNMRVALTSELRRGSKTMCVECARGVHRAHRDKLKSEYWAASAGGRS